MLYYNFEFLSAYRCLLYRQGVPQVFKRLNLFITIKYFVWRWWSLWGTRYEQSLAINSSAVWQDMYGSQNRCSDKSPWRFGGCEVLSYRRFTIFLFLHTHARELHISFQKSCQCCLPFTTKALVRSLSSQCEISEGQSGIWGFFLFEYFGFLLLMLHIMHLNMAYSSNWEIRTVRWEGLFGLPGNPDYRVVTQWCKYMQESSHRA